MLQDWKENDVVIGRRLDDGKEMVIPAEDRRTHLYVVGSSGKGKSQFLQHVIREDIRTWHRHGCGMLVIDFHGDIYHGVMQALAGSRTPSEAAYLPIVPIDMTRDDYTIAYNPLRQMESKHVDAVISEVVSGMAYCWGASGTDDTPLFEQVASNTLYALYALGHTLADAPRLLEPEDATFRKLVADGLEGNLARYWERLSHNTTPKSYRDEVGSSVRRFKRFEDNTRLSSMFGVPKVSFDFGQAMEEGQIVLVNLSLAGGWGSDKQARTIATLLLSDLWAQARIRSSKGEKARPFRVVIDEFQKAITPTIAEDMNEARGYGLSMTLATQTPTFLNTQGDAGRAIYQSINNNAQSQVVFRLQEKESRELMADILYADTFDPDQVKFDQYATKVLRYNRTTFESGSSGTSSGGGSSDIFDADGQLVGSTRVDNDGASEQRGWHEGLEPILGREHVGRQFRPIDDQRYYAAKKILSQDVQHALVRTNSMKAPVACKVATIKPGGVSSAYTNEFVRHFLERLPFALKSDEARRIIKERQAKLLSASPGQEEDLWQKVDT